MRRNKHKTKLFYQNMVQILYYAKQRNFFYSSLIIKVHSGVQLIFFMHLFDCNGIFFLKIARKIDLNHLHLSLSAWADETATNRTTAATNKFFILKKNPLEISIKEI